MTTSHRILFGTISISTILALWLFLTLKQYVPPLFLPGPVQILEQLRSGPSAEQWLWDLIASNLRVIVAFLIAVIIAFPLGVSIGAIPKISAFILPIVEMTRYIPVPALLPLCILWTGVGEVEKILVIFLGTVFQLTISIAFAIHSVPSGFVQTGLTLGLTKWSILKKVIVPAASPLIYDAIRVSFAWAWSYLVVAEIIGASAGIGYRLMSSQRYIQTGLVFFGIAQLAALGWLSDFAFRKLRGVVLPWTA